MKKFSFIIVYLAAFVAANILVKEMGSKGLWFSSFLLIPFDFVCRCLFHETWKGKKLILYLTLLTIASGVITFAFNNAALNIALASFVGFGAAQIGAGIFYQCFKKQTFFIKVNGSDVIAIICDSILFQLVAFNLLDWKITAGQIVVKTLGGLLWYFIFKKLGLWKKLS